jgi:hypothetical protein
MAEYPYPDPVVQISDVRELARDLVVIPNQRVHLVPNIGIIAGTQSVPVIETGMGPRNAERVLKFAADYAKGRRLYLTTTHFHAEQAFGAQVFAGHATYLLNKSQADDLATKGPGYIGMFRGLGEPVARQLAAASAGVLAVIVLEAGWTVSEVGRQPWIVYEQMKVEDAATANTGIWITFIGVVILYVGLGVTTILVLRMMSRRFREGARVLEGDVPYGPSELATASETEADQKVPL